MGISGRLRSVVGHRGERLVVWVVVVGLVGGTGYLLFAGAPALGGEGSSDGPGGVTQPNGTDSRDDQPGTTTRSNGTVAPDDQPGTTTRSKETAIPDFEGVNVSQSNNNYVLTPASGESETGLVFYPGGNVPPRPYVYSLEPLAREANATVVVVKMPGNLAFLDQGAANRVIDRRTDIDEWYVGGHSLGGAISCRYARNNADRLDGVVLFASYCDRSIADTDLQVLSVRGSEDVVLNVTAYERNKDNLPNDSTLVTVSGMNHSQFGNYTDQPDDSPAELTYEQAHARLANVAVPWFRMRAVERAE